MPNSHHVTSFAGLPAVEFPSWDTIRDEFTTAMRWARNRNEPHETLPRSYRPLFEALAAPDSVAWRLCMPVDLCIGEKTWEDLDPYLDRFTELVPPESVRALIVGNLADQDFQFRSTELRDRLITLAPKLTHLHSLFFGEVLREEQEISWIEHGDLAPLLAALPHLTGFTVRGGSGPLGLRVDGHPSLRELTVQSGGLRPEVVRDVCASSLPVLEHLELWLGDEEYAGGAAATADDLAPVLSGEAFPELRHLGLRNSDAAGRWVRALADAPVTRTLDTLDLSLGALRDEDVDALLDAPAFRGLKRLDLHHHFLSEENAERVRAAFTEAGVEVDLSDPQEPDTYGDEIYYYTAVAE
ncbi:STM4015 family protein [Nocardiopsis sp. FIRDI 009]|uniref:STM4015 family protein n=1 Tax=Nocardiopsis sp. FIRDI 009 TaxID=714197 RepID=UPI000E254322|nr:STM4015 family protein [Nocardiopsis sp. FIRDI 009]